MAIGTLPEGERLKNNNELRINKYNCSSQSPPRGI